MKIDRTALVVPTRYRNAKIRQVMGRNIAMADSDDLLAAWLWATEAWILREFYYNLDKHRAAAEETRREAYRRLNARWDDDFAPVPQAIRESIDECLKDIAAAAAEAAREAQRCLEIAYTSWKNISDECGLDPRDFFHRDHTATRTSPLEAISEAWDQSDRSMERFDQAVAAHRDAVHELALQENRRRKHLAEGALSVEGRFLHSTYRQLTAHRRALRTEDKQCLSGTYSAPKAWSLPMQIAKEADASAHFRRTIDMLDALEAANESVDTCTEIWEEVAADFGLCPASAPPLQRHPNGPAKVVAIAELARQLDAARADMQKILATHREAVHGSALILNRRITHLMKTPPVDLEEIDELHHREFENLVADLARRDGMTITRSHGGSGDLGADVGAVTVDNRLVVFQAKHTASGRSIGTPDLQRFNGTARPHHKADIAVLVTNGTFTAPAVHFAREHNIRLVGRQALRQWAALGDPLHEVVELP
ncbi:restriction endonuclease [Kitasatospora sp. NPDC001540]|uniref:restriction endonuclease n=1 Tax=Kitasatospora sp. NPDC001540 TaxID=3364014 RepID=UPI0036CA30B5